MDSECWHGTVCAVSIGKGETSGNLLQKFAGLQTFFRMRGYVRPISKKRRRGAGGRLDVCREAGGDWFIAVLSPLVIVKDQEWVSL
jgi:hypothetical protein